MDIVCEQECKELIEISLEKSMSYDSYTEFVNDLAEESATSGEEQSEGRIGFTKLNQRRMKRWNKTLKVSEEVQKTIESSAKYITWIVLTESWCGDAAHVLPAINKVASLSDKINLKVLLRDNNPELMNNFLTDGTQSIPKLIMIDDASGSVIDTYGSRPRILNKMVKEYKQLHGKVTAEFKEEMQKWYNKDKGQTIISELSELL